MHELLKDDLRIARATLAERGDATDKLLFERLGYYEGSRTEMTYRTSGGLDRKRPRTDVVADSRIAEELASIMSWRLGFTPSFWGSAGYALAKEKEEARVEANRKRTEDDKRDHDARGS